MKSADVVERRREVAVAPVRERGLKYITSARHKNLYPGRSREGAWIEIIVEDCYNLPENSRSREGAWIEIPLSSWYTISFIVAPVRERGLKSN